MKRIAFTVLLLGLIPTHGFAQEAETIERVQGHFERGATAFANKDFETAIREFEAGNGLLPDPIFLYNISLAHGMLGRVEQSLAVARLAEATGLDEPDATQNRARIVGLTRAANAEVVSATMPTPVVPPVVSSSPPLLSWYGWTGVGTVGLGLLSLTAATIVDISIGPDIDSFEQAAAAGDTLTYRRLKSDIESDQATAKTLFFAGLGLTAIGAALVSYDVFFHSNEVDTGLTLSGAPDGAMSTFHIRW